MLVSGCDPGQCLVPFTGPDPAPSPVGPQPISASAHHCPQGGAECQGCPLLSCENRCKKEYDISHATNFQLSCDWSDLNVYLE